MSLDLLKCLDYRDFLRSWLEEARRRYGFSYRAFSRKAGFRSHSFFKMVMDGKRDLQGSGLEKFMDGLGIQGLEREYFRNLVAFNQARNQRIRKGYFQKLKLFQNLAGSKMREWFDKPLEAEVDAEKILELRSFLEKWRTELRQLEATARNCSNKYLVKILVLPV